MDSLVHHSRWEHCKLWDDVLKSVSDVDLPQFLAQAVDVSPEDDATIVFTSGTYVLHCIRHTQCQYADSAIVLGYRKES